jgi:hypothetical protein
MTVGLRLVLDSQQLWLVDAKDRRRQAVLLQLFDQLLTAERLFTSNCSGRPARCGA